MKRLVYTILLAAPEFPDGVEVMVEVRWPDQVLGEREGPRHGLTNDTPLQLTNYWIWAALKRTGRYAGDFQQFTNVDLLDLEPPDKRASVTVDPTQPTAPSEPASP